MPVLPTAHASQSYGRRQLEFFATTGHITGSDRRQRASERRFQDMDGGVHTVRLANSDAPVSPGDSVAVLRAQSGPDRQSRPVSVINYATHTWEPAAPDATRALSRAGITRGLNWWLSMIVLALAAIALVWPDLRTALGELNPSMFGGLPAFDLVGLVAAQAGFLLGADPAASIPGIGQVVGSTGFLGAEDSNGVLLGAGLGVLGLIAYVGRTWRVVWIPAFLDAALAAGLVLAGTDGAAGVVLIAIGSLAGFFCIAGFINRVRDASRFRSRVSRLSEHMLRNPPQESVVSPPVSEPRRVSDAAVAAAAGPLAAAAATDAAIAEAPVLDAEQAEAEVADDSADDSEGVADSEVADDSDETAPEALAAETDRIHADPAEDADAGTIDQPESVDDAPRTTDAPEAAGDDPDIRDVTPTASPEPETAREAPEDAEAPRTLSASPAMEAPDEAVSDRDSRTSAAFGALAAAMHTDSAPAAEREDDEGDSDALPSDAELDRARNADLDAQSATPGHTDSPEDRPTSDRDMSLPEPPPLATTQEGAMASAPQAGIEAGDVDDADREPAAAAETEEPAAMAGFENDPRNEDDNDPMMARSDREPSDPDPADRDPADPDPADPERQA